MRFRPPVSGLLALTLLRLPASAQEPDPLHVWSTVNVVGQATGADRIPAELTGSVDLFADLLVGSAVIHAYVEGNTTPRAGGVSTRVPNANMDAGTALGGDGDGRVQLSELRVAWPTGGRTVAHVGLMDLTGFVDVSRIANDENLYFLAQPFVNNPTILFPDYTLGAVFLTRVSGIPDGRLAFALSSSHGIADTPDASYGALFDVAAPGRGAFAAARLEWEGLRWRGSVGAWGSSGERTEDGGPGARALPDRGLFGVLGWHGDAQSLSGRLGFARGPAATEAFVGLTWLATLGANAVGVGVARTPALPRVVDRSGSHVEAFVRRDLWETVYLTSSVQWLSDALLPEGREGDGLWIFGFRLSATF